MKMVGDWVCIYRITTLSDQRVRWTTPSHITQSSRYQAIWGPPQRTGFPQKSVVSLLTVTSPVMISMQLNYVVLIFKDTGSFKFHLWLKVSNWSCGLLSPEGWEMRAASSVGGKAIILAFHLIQSFSTAYAFRNSVIFVIICAVGVSIHLKFWFNLYTCIYKIFCVRFCVQVNAKLSWDCLFNYNTKDN